MKKKFVWLNTMTGEFSNSWFEGEFSTKLEDLLEMHNDSKKSEEENKCWKLIEYFCHTDHDFEFSQLMRLR